MECRRVLTALCILTLCCSAIEAKVFTRCQLVGELLKLNFPRSFISNWVCMIEQESGRNTAARMMKNGRWHYGLFQIGSEYCGERSPGGICNIKCDALLNEDLTDDAVCVKKLFDREGFKYWSNWTARCKGKPLPDVTQCPEWKV